MGYSTSDPMNSTTTLELKAQNIHSCESSNHITYCNLHHSIESLPSSAISPLIYTIHDRRQNPQPDWLQPFNLPTSLLYQMNADQPNVLFATREHHVMILKCEVNPKPLTPVTKTTPLRLPPNLFFLHNTN